MDKKLYQVDSDNFLSSKDIYQSLVSLGVDASDTILVHSDILSFGKIVNPSTILKDLTDVIKSVVPFGTIIMPTYTYSFTKNETYNPDETPSTVGSLTNYFKSQPETYRTLDPIVSVSVLGDKKYLQCDTRNCFGENSVYSEILKSCGKILILGSKFEKSLTFLHFVEQKFGVYYRSLKRFEGKKIVGNEQIDDFCYFYVREPKETIKVDLEPLKHHLINKELMKTIKIGPGYISCIDTRDLHSECLMLLKKDEGIFLSKTCNKKIE